MNPTTSNDSTAAAESSAPNKQISMSKTPLLTATQIRQRIQRLAWQLYEDNSGENEIVLAGIVQTGHQVALRLAEALRAGADAVLVASILHDGEYTVAQLKAALVALGLHGRIRL